MILVHTGSPELVGQYGLASALAAPVFAFANLQLRGLQGTDARGEFEFGHYFALRIIASSLALVVALGIALSSSYEPVIVIVTALIAVKLAVNSIADVFYGLLQQKERLDRISQAAIVTSVLNVILFSVAMLATDSLVVAVSSAAFASIVPLILLVVPSAKAEINFPFESSSLAPKWQATQLARLFSQAFPLAVVSLLISLNTNVPRYFLSDLTSAAQLGVYVALISLLVASDTFVTAVAQTVSPRLAKHFARGEKADFLALIGRLEILGLSIGVVAVYLAYMIGPSVVSWIYEPVYGQERATIVWIAVSAAIGMMSRFVGNAITVARKLRIQVLNSILGLSALIGACALLIPGKGIEGAAIAVALSALVRYLLNGIVLIRFLLQWKPHSAL